MALLPPVETFENVVSSEPTVDAVVLGLLLNKQVCPETKPAVPAVNAAYFYLTNMCSLQEEGEISRFLESSSRIPSLLSNLKKEPSL